MRALLIGVETKYDRYDINYSLDELKALAEVIGYEVIYTLKQSLDSPNKATYIGSGKVGEALIAIHAYDIDTVILNDELTPSQIRNLSDELKVNVIDRTYLILKIFETRASNRESSLEIKLAKDYYLLPRIQFLRNKEDRIGGGGITRGAGETQKELDKRHLESEIVHIQNELKQIRKMKTQQIEKRKRNEIPIVSLVGYTNAGKSSTMNTLLSLTNKDNLVLAKDQLFATLQTYNRNITYNKKEFLLVDTIGFISKLPHNLVNSFYQTLEEIKNSDLIILVVDSSSKYINEELKVVSEVLYMLHATDIPTICLLNKWDLNENKNLNFHGIRSIEFSNKTGLNNKELLDIILEYVSPSTLRVKLLIPYKYGDLANIIEEKCEIYYKDYRNNGTFYECELPIKLYSKFRDFDTESYVS